MAVGCHQHRDVCAQGAQHGGQAAHLVDHPPVADRVRAEQDQRASLRERGGGRVHGEEDVDPRLRERTRRGLPLPGRAALQHHHASTPCARFPEEDVSHRRRGGERQDVALFGEELGRPAGQGLPVGVEGGPERAGRPTRRSAGTLEPLHPVQGVQDVGGERDQGGHGRLRLDQADARLGEELPELGRRIRAVPPGHLLKDARGPVRQPRGARDHVVAQGGDERVQALRAVHGAGSPAGAETDDGRPKLRGLTPAQNPVIVRARAGCRGGSVGLHAPAPGSGPEKNTCPTFRPISSIRKSTST